MKRDEGLKTNDRSSESGCLRIESPDLTDIPADDIIILIWFHGDRGLTFGPFDDPDGVEAAANVVGKAITFNESRR